MAMPDPDPMKPADLAAHRPPAWLRGGHLQTLWPAVITPRAQVALRRERWTTPDADFIEVDRVDSPAGMRAPLVVLFHGLEGNSDSPYARSLMAAVAERGSLVYAARDVAAGCGDGQARMNRVDELGMLMRAVNQAGLNLRSLVDDVGEQVGGVAVVVVRAGE